MQIPITRLIACSAAFLAITVHTASADPPRGHHRQTLYEVTDLDSLGGLSSSGNSISNRGWVAGSSNLPGDDVAHAVLWIHGSIFDLGTLGGPTSNSSVIWPGQNDRGMIVGVTETGEADPRGEPWACSVFFPSATGEICLGFVWRHGEMTPLDTLGGTHGFATGVNNRGHIVGWSETEVEDPSCNPPQQLQFLATVWNADGEVIDRLPPLPGDSVSAATGINSRGQVIGISGICSNAVGGFSARNAVLWENGEPTRIDDLGGIAWHTPMAINQRGDVVGFSNPAPDEDGSFNVRAFFWAKRGGIVNLETLDGDSTSQALGINARRQVVGVSTGGDGNTAFLWEGDELINLNDRLVPGYGGYLEIAGDINDRGQITGVAFYEDRNERVAFIATPVRGRGRR